LPDKLSRQCSSETKSTASQPVTGGKAMPAHKSNSKWSWAIAVVALTIAAIAVARALAL
jgi:hypothetical protein